MRVIWVAYDSLHKTLSLKTLILSLVVVIAIVLVALASSDYFNTRGPAWHDLFRKQIYRDFMSKLYLLAQMLLTPFIIIISALAARDMYRGETDNLYLTGGLSKTVAFTGRSIGLMAYISLLWWGLFILTAAVLLFTGLENISGSMVMTFLRLGVNSTALSFLSWSLVGLSRTVIVGTAPLLIHQFWLTVNSNISAETAGTSLHAAVNYLLPLNTFCQFPNPEVDPLYLLTQYHGLAPWHGSLLLITFILLSLLLALNQYIVRQDQ